MKIACVTGSRADWSAVEMVYSALRSAGHQMTLVEVGPTQKIYTRLQTTLATATAIHLVEEADHADLAVLAGDRYEILGAAVGFYLLGVPIAHLSGGDVTLGSADDQMRDAISMLASIHFPTHTEAAERLRRMGVRGPVHDIGAPSIDRIFRLMEKWDEEDRMQQMWAGPRPDQSEVLLEMPRGLHEAVAKDTPAEGTGEKKNHREGLRPGLQKARKADPATVRDLRSEEQPDAPSQLRQAARSEMALPDPSSGAPQNARETFLNQNLSIAEKWSEKNIVVAIHPATVEPYGLLECDELLLALRSLEAKLAIEKVSFFVVSPNADVGNHEMSQRLKGFCFERPNALFVGNLKPEDYISLLRHCDCLVGNSSSGIYEAPVLGTPSIMVGNRQNGRPRTATRYVPADASAIRNALLYALYVSRLAPCTLFGDGHAAERIATVIGAWGIRGSADQTDRRG